MDIAHVAPLYWRRLRLVGDRVRFLDAHPEREAALATALTRGVDNISDAELGELGLTRDEVRYWSRVEQLQAVLNHRFDNPYVERRRPPRPELSQRARPSTAPRRRRYGRAHRRRGPPGEKPRRRTAGAA